MPSVTLAPLLPMVKPLMVTVRASVGLTAATDVSTTAVAPVGPQTIFKPGTLLAPTATTGVMWGTKKFGG